MSTKTITFEELEGFDASEFDVIFLSPPGGPFRLVFNRMLAQKVIPGQKIPMPDQKELLVEVRDANSQDVFNAVHDALLPTTGRDGWHRSI